MVWPAELAGWRKDGWVELPSWRTDVPDNRLSAREGAPDVGGRGRSRRPRVASRFHCFRPRESCQQVVDAALRILFRREVVRGRGDVNEYWAGSTRLPERSTTVAMSVVWALTGAGGCTGEPARTACMRATSGDAEAQPLWAFLGQGILLLSCCRNTSHVVRHRGIAAGTMKGDVDCAADYSCAQHTSARNFGRVTDPNANGGTAMLLTAAERALGGYPTVAESGRPWTFWSREMVYFPLRQRNPQLLKLEK